MSRGKKAKRKIAGGRRRAETGAVVVAATMRLAAAAEGAAVMSINKSRTLDLSKHRNTMDNSVRSLTCNAEQVSKIVRVKKKSDEKLSESCGDGEIKSSSFTILFKSDELQTLRSILRKSDLSRTPLLLGAIILGKVDVVKRLLRDGYPINSRSEEDKTTALMWAVRNKDLEMINLLVRHGADLTLLDENEDNVALIAVQSSSWEQNDFLDFWSSIDRKIDLKHANTRGYTILHYAKERRWHTLEDLIGNLEPRDFTTNTSIVPRSASCFCCYCTTSSSSSSSTTTLRYKVKEVLLREDVETTLGHLTIFFEEIVNRYREIWSRDRELGYPGFRGGHGDSAATLEDLMSLRREEIARLNTILPKLEESYLQKLRDCWSSVVTKMRQIAAKNSRKFDEYVTSIQIKLLTHQVCPRSVENIEFYPADVKTFNPPLANEETNPPTLTQVYDVCSHKNVELPAKLTLN